MEKIAEILSIRYPQFNTVSPTYTVNDALYQMCCENVEYLIVMDDRKFLGILTEHDIANKVLLINKPLTEIQVKDFMSSRLPMATVNDTIEYCMQLIDRHNTHYMAVYDNFDFKGIVSSYDLMRHALKRSDAFNEPGEKNTYQWNY